MNLISVLMKCCCFTVLTCWQLPWSCPRLHHRFHQGKPGKMFSRHAHNTFRTQSSAPTKRARPAATPQPSKSSLIFLLLLRRRPTTPTTRPALPALFPSPFLPINTAVMGRVRTKTVKKSAKVIIERYVLPFLPPHSPQIQNPNSS